MYKVIFLFYYPILLPHFILYLTSRNRMLIDQDLMKWGERHSIAGSKFKKLFHFLIFGKDFRTIFYFRTREVFFSKILRLYLPKEKYFFIDPRTKIGGGFTSAHPYATILNAKSIGENFFVNQLVTVGEVDGKRPTIGDNVSIYSGAIIIGGINIGDNCIIGAGAVVVKDIPNKSTVVGNPARIIHKG